MERFVTSPNLCFDTVLEYYLLQKLKLLGRVQTMHFKLSNNMTVTIIPTRGGGVVSNSYITWIVGFG